MKGFAIEIDSSVYKKRLNLVAGSGILVYGGTMFMLNELWYKQFERTSFHWFDDSKGWMQIDKWGHVHSAYFESIWSIESLKWAGVPAKKAAVYGAGVAFTYQSTIELLDGFSAKWGASYTDIMANALGCLTAMSQELKWGNQAFIVKYSFHPKKYDDKQLQERSESLFGTQWNEVFLKDYNGQTYWVSLNLKHFCKNSKVPEWLNIAYGYSAENMFGGEENKWQGSEGMVYRYDMPRYRQHFLSLDVDFSKIPCQKKGLKALLVFLNTFKMPFSSLVYDRINGLQFLPIYF